LATEMGDHKTDQPDGVDEMDSMDDHAFGNARGKAAP
jgi:hypothetical protein